jgi:hypothetical protein
MILHFMVVIPSLRKPKLIVILAIEPIGIIWQFRWREFHPIMFQQSPERRAGFQAEAEDMIFVMEGFKCVTCDRKETHLH